MSHDLYCAFLCFSFFFLAISSRVMLYFSYQLMCCLVCSGRCSILFLSCFCISCIFLYTRSCAILCHVVLLVSTHVLFRALRFLMFHAFSVLLLSFYLILCLSCVSRVFFLGTRSRAMLFRFRCSGHR